MLTQGQIVQIYTQKTLNSTSTECGQYLVHIPLFDTVTKINTKVVAHAIYNPGSFGAYEVGDLVWVGFEKNEAGKPVILGKIYKGRETATELNNFKSIIAGADLKIKNNAELPYDTSFSKITFSELHTEVNNLKKEFEKFDPLVNVQNALNYSDDNRYVKTKSIKFNSIVSFSNGNVKTAQLDVLNYNLILNQITVAGAYNLANQNPNYILPSGNLIIHNISCVGKVDTKHLNLSDCISIETTGSGTSRTNKIIFDTDVFTRIYQSTSLGNITLDYFNLNIEFSILK